MITSIKIYSDPSDQDIYAYCTYTLLRNRGKHTEDFRLELRYTDRVSGEGDFKSGMPIYDLYFKQRILDYWNSPHKELVLEYTSHGYDQHTILEFFGDSPEHRDFLAQVGIHD